MPRDCTLQLDVYFPFSLTEEYDEDVVAWSVSSDPDHPFPYLIGPRQYSTQEIDPIACTASIGQVEVGVIDVPTNPDDQDTGWMTARVHDVMGRRCVLRRYINSSIGWVVIADGPAGSPKMDQSYAAYRWTIRDTRDTERKTLAFVAGGVASVVPRGSVYGWGAYEDSEGEHFILPAALDNPIIGQMSVVNFGVATGYVFTQKHLFGPNTVVDDPRVELDDDGATAVTTSQIGENAFAAKFVDVLWRKVGDSAWNIARPRSTVAFNQPVVGVRDAILHEGDDQNVRVVDYVALYIEPSGVAPGGFPANGDMVEFVLRYLGPASEAFPYYVEGSLGSVLTKLYTGGYTVPENAGVSGFVYDPADLYAADSSQIAPIRFDPDALDALTEHVLLRQTEAIDDGRAFTEARLFSPSGWIAALDNDGRISPVSRGRPVSIDPYSVITNAEVVPTPGWYTGASLVSSIRYDYSRFFIPAPDSGFTVAADGLAIRPIDVQFKDEESRLRYGDNPETFDATAFSAVGTPVGLNLPGVTEQADLLAQIARFDVLQRFRAGVQAIAIRARRMHLPDVRVGSWIPWDLSWLPSRVTGLRGSQVDAAQIVSIMDDSCTWRTLTLQESAAEGAFGGDPGFYSDLHVLTDEFEPGTYIDLVEVSDVEDDDGDTGDSGATDSNPTSSWLTVSASIPSTGSAAVSIFLRLADARPTGWHAKIYIDERLGAGSLDPVAGGDRSSELTPPGDSPSTTLSAHSWTSEFTHTEPFVFVSVNWEMIADLCDEFDVVQDTRTVTLTWHTG